MAETPTTRDLLAQGLQVPTGTTKVFKLTTGTGEIHVVVRDHGGAAPIANVAYTITGPHGVSYGGTTGEQGEIHHPNPIPIDHYELKLPGTYDAPIQILSAPPGGDPEVHRIPGYPREEPIDVPKDVEVVLLRKRGHPASCQNGCPDEIPYFKQWGATWNSDPERPERTGKSKGKCRPLYKEYIPEITLWNSGCGVCSAAMFFAAAGIKPFKAKEPGIESTDYNDPNAYEPAGDKLTPVNFIHYMVDYCDKRFGPGSIRRPQPYGQAGGPNQRNLWNMFMLPKGGTIGWTKKVTKVGKVQVPDPDNPIVDCLKLLVRLSTGRDYPLTYKIVPAWVKPGQKSSALNERLEAGIPVIMTTLHGGGKGHFVLAVGYRKSGGKYYYYMNDPGWEANPYDYKARNNWTKDLSKYVKRSHSDQTGSLCCKEHEHGGGYEQIVSLYVVEGIDELFDLIPWWPGQGS